MVSETCIAYCSHHFLVLLFSDMYHRIYFPGCYFFLKFRKLSIFIFAVGLEIVTVNWIDQFAVVSSFLFRIKCIFIYSIVRAGMNLFCSLFKYRCVITWCIVFINRTKRMSRSNDPTMELDNEFLGSYSFFYVIKKFLNFLVIKRRNYPTRSVILLFLLTTKPIILLFIRP